MFTQLKQYRVVMEVKPDFQKGPQTLQDIYVRSASGGQVPLSTFTQTTETTAPLIVSHQGQFPAVTLSFNLASGVSLGEAVPAGEAAPQQIGPPAGLRGSFQGAPHVFHAPVTNG